MAAILPSSLLDMRENTLLVGHMIKFPECLTRLPVHLTVMQLICIATLHSPVSYSRSFVRNARLSNTKRPVFAFEILETETWTPTI